MSATTIYVCVPLGSQLNNASSPIGDAKNVFDDFDLIVLPKISQQ